MNPGCSESEPLKAEKTGDCLANPAQPAEPETVARVLDRFQPITLGEIEPNGYFSRFDNKFIMHQGKLVPLLQSLAREFRVLENKGLRLFPYDSLYLDTDDFLFFHQHHSRRSNRIKVRWRTYRDSGRVYFEVKRKCHNNRTEKLRMEEPAILETLEPRHLALFQSHAPAGTRLSPKISIRYDRMTLFAKQESIKITLDQNLSFDNTRDTHSLHGLVIGEIKCAQPRVPTCLLEILRGLAIRSVPFSKYAFGIGSMEPVKNNGIKPTSLLLKKILHEQQSA